MNDMFLPLKVTASALEAQKVRINVIASNIANASTTRTPEGGPYRKRDVVFESYMFDHNATGVNIAKIVEDKRPFRTVYDPSHPDANESGYVNYPNVNNIEEMVNLMNASRAYESNLTILTTYKDSFTRTLDLLKA